MADLSARLARELGSIDSRINNLEEVASKMDEKLDNALNRADEHELKLERVNSKINTIWIAIFTLSFISGVISKEFAQVIFSIFK